MLRPLQADDTAALTAYFLGLSERTVSLYRPHPFDQSTAAQLCANLDPSRALRMVVVTDAGEQRRIIAYFIVDFEIRDSDAARYRERDMPLSVATDCELAPSVADAYQGQGVGSLVMCHVVPWLREIGKQRLVLLGGVRQHNALAIAFYRKHGFEVVGEYLTKAPNYDMIAVLQAR